MRGEPVSPVSASSNNGEDERELRGEPSQAGTRASTPTLADDSPFVGYRQAGAQSRNWSPEADPNGIDRHLGFDNLQPTAPRPWSPLFLRRTVLSGLVAFLIALMIAIAALFGVSNRDGGLASADQRLYYLWVYGPTAGTSLDLEFRDQS